MTKRRKVKSNIMKMKINRMNKDVKYNNKLKINMKIITMKKRVRAIKMMIRGETKNKLMSKSLVMSKQGN